MVLGGWEVTGGTAVSIFSREISTDAIGVGRQSGSTGRQRQSTEAEMNNLHNRADKLAYFKTKAVNKWEMRGDLGNTYC